ncbi:hypothetical protein [Chengkuizengella axinellae]|uniref:Uncharacterized protein n=1 Tax=Chengkuizengella axinellae TaxID=3064388 RepID=A0ABT9IXL5_9BACL|nr:hypothetical protein [Chengkuizengella sp. 2205SS18-9]MDP5274053.1 hypothetical protein [Chengkuizengella sp. 2205SS18-9]
MFVKEPEKTQVLLDSMVQIAVTNNDESGVSFTAFEVIYRILRNGGELSRITA